MVKKLVEDCQGCSDTAERLSRLSGGAMNSSSSYVYHTFENLTVVSGQWNPELYCNFIRSQEVVH